MGNTAHMYAKLATIISPENLILYPEMDKLTSFRAGGRAQMIVIAQGPMQLLHALRVFAEEDIEFVVMGNGTNILVRDGGYDGVILKLGEYFSSIDIRKSEDNPQAYDRTGNLSYQKSLLVAGGSVLLSQLARAAQNAELTGLEFAAGIPGSVGGALFMNAGAYGGEIKDVTVLAEVISRDGSVRKLLEPSELELSYRHSALQDTGDIVVRAFFQLDRGNPDEINEKMRDFAARRSEKQPLNLPSAGSFFKRPEGHFAGALIQESGLKGMSVGAAQVSPLHAGFIVNNGGAKAKDIIQLMELVQNTVYDKFGVWLEPEVRIIGNDL